MRKLFVLLVIVLTATAAYLWFSPKDNSDVLQTDNELLPDYVALKVTRRLYNEQGRLVDLARYRHGHWLAHLRSRQAHRAAGGPSGGADHKVQTRA